MYSKQNDIVNMYNFKEATNKHSLRPNQLPTAYLATVLDTARDHHILTWLPNHSQVYTYNVCTCKSMTVR